MNNRWLLAGLTGLWLVALAIVFKTSIDALEPPSWGNPISTALSPEVAGNNLVGQAFTAPLAGLYRIEVPLLPALAPVDRPITFHLKRDPAAFEDLWSITLNSSALKADVPCNFEFEPIRGSKGQSFYFYLDSTESRPGEAVTIPYGPASVLEGASAHFDGQRVAGNLVFQTHYTLRTRDKLDLLLTRLTAGRPYVLGIKGFYVGLALVYGLLLVLLFFQVSRPANGGSE